MVDRHRLITAGSRVRLRLAPDERLVADVRRGDTAAFEALYERHATELLSFCVYMLGSRQDAEDALQTTFASAYRALLADGRPIALRAWLFTVARNACLSILRRRRPVAELTGEEVALVEGPAHELELREDIRTMLEGLRELPEHQRAALVMAEVHGLSQAEIGEVLSVRPEQVKAYIYQARTNLISDREAREADCRSIREELATARGAARLRGRLRRHMRTCAGCRVYADGVASQRRHLGALIPFVPSLTLKYRALEDALSAVATDPGTYGGGAAVGAAVELAGGGMKGLLVKVAASVACLGASAGVGVSVLTGEHEALGGGASTAAREHAPLVASLDGEGSSDGGSGVPAETRGQRGTRGSAGGRGTGGGSGLLRRQREGGRGGHLGRPAGGAEGTSAGGGEGRGAGGRERGPRGGAATPAGEEASQRGREERQARGEGERLQQHDERQRRREVEMPGGGSRSPKAEEERALKREERKPKGASRPPRTQEELALKRERRIRKHEEHRRELKETEEAH